MGPNCGPYRSQTQALAEVVRRLVDALDPEAIWLFGSRARRTHRPTSDFDLLVVTRDDDDAGSDYQHVYAPIAGSGIGCDVVPCPKHVFEHERNAGAGLVRAVVREGRRLYERR